MFPLSKVMQHYDFLIYMYMYTKDVLKKYDIILQPKFLTKEERAAEALKKRQQQVEEQRRLIEEEKKKQMDFLNKGKDRGTYNIFLSSHGGGGI